jgi:hypothetical protein
VAGGPVSIATKQSSRDRAATGAGEQHTQEGLDFDRAAERRAVAVVLVHADRRREPDDGIHGRAAFEGHHPQRFHVLALAFLVQRIEGHGRFARPRQPAKNHQLVLGDREGDVFQVVEAGSTDSYFGHVGW